MKKNIYRSRLTNRLEKQTRKTLFLSILGILIVITVLFKFAIPLLVNFSLFISGVKSSQETVEKQNSNSFIAPPVLNPLPNATNSAMLTIAGMASSSQTVNLYVNDNLIDKTKTENDGSFAFNDIRLSRNENSIRTKIITEDNRESAFSNTITVIFKDTPPLLSVDSPSDGQSFSKDENLITILGNTNPQVKITVNGFRAIVDENGKFSYSLQLQNGENQIKIIAIDEADNKTEMERKVTYSP